MQSSVNGIGCFCVCEMRCAPVILTLVIASVIRLHRIFGSNYLAASEQRKLDLLNL